jgi:hypothetical protein
MNYVENLKSPQLRKLFRIFKSRPMQNLNIFGAELEIVNNIFEFTILS